MTRGRKNNTDKPIRLEVTLPESVIKPVDLALTDPARGKPVYGARSKLIARLLRNWLDDVGKGKVRVTDYTGGI